MYIGKQGKADAIDRAAALNKIEGVTARVGHHRTNSEDRYPVHVTHKDAALVPYTESGR